MTDLERSWSLASFLFLCCLKRTGSVFLTLREVFLAFRWSIKLYISILMYLLNLLTDLLKWTKLVSYTKWWTLENLISWLESFIFIYQEQRWPKNWTLSNTIFYEVFFRYATINGNKLFSGEEVGFRLIICHTMDAIMFKIS